MDDTLTLELDFAFENESLADALFVTTSPYDSITYRIEALRGPGGGWPSVRFTGSTIEMQEFVLEYCGGAHEQAYELLMG